MHLHIQDNLFSLFYLNQLRFRAQVINFIENDFCAFFQRAYNEFFRLTGVSYWYYLCFALDKQYRAKAQAFASSPTFRQTQPLGGLAGPLIAVEVTMQVTSWMKALRIAAAAGILALLVLFAMFAQAQVETGRFVGHVTDAQGAVVEHAQVKLLT
ncbi:MAG TPA: hypothetical protein VHD85_03255 [Terracidiphilus sp.]|nr:hypothetical protein [Terracidiphilus sp.]